MTLTVTAPWVQITLTLNAPPTTTPWKRCSWSNDILLTSMGIVSGLFQMPYNIVWACLPVIRVSCVEVVEHRRVREGGDCLPCHPRHNATAFFASCAHRLLHQRLDTARRQSQCVFQEKHSACVIQRILRHQWIQCSLRRTHFMGAIPPISCWVIRT